MGAYSVLTKSKCAKIVSFEIALEVLKSCWNIFIWTFLATFGNSQKIDGNLQIKMPARFQQSWSWQDENLTHLTQEKCWQVYAYTIELLQLIQ